MPRITLLNGPNLNLLGEREPEIYGRTTLAEIEARCLALAGALDLSLRFEQSNSEAVLVDAIQEERIRSDALIINPAGLSFHSVPILDAIRIFRGPVIELHLSNIHARDAAHRHSIQSAAATGVICGLGPYGYQVAMLAALDLIGHRADPLPGWLLGPGV
ncbi:type II 3-dehydroquinate dehydratase [Roseicyclus persicicus]|uniref:3-dehydroquinate dehydratase n=1 Tax=Roseicyclus persicicus TaxID=2650661 RepID=A0A7X6H004_9RHOB|nr:type II 3-dehydroquinate dehydratase [Roseibacterium persicicum]NKX45519.1 3-dehydroquinate dehydratase [Roseibacterium persicicum]